MEPLLRLQKSKQTREFQSRKQLGKPSKARMNGRWCFVELVQRMNLHSCCIKNVAYIKISSLSKKEYPELPGSRFLMLYDVDHIKAKKNKQGNAEHPDNYQLLCKSCHGAKSIVNQDYYNKKYDNYKKLERKNLLDLDFWEIIDNIKIRKDKLLKRN